MTTIYEDIRRKIESMVDGEIGLIGRYTYEHPYMNELDRDINASYILFTKGACNARGRIIKGSGELVGSHISEIMPLIAEKRDLSEHLFRVGRRSKGKTTTFEPEFIRQGVEKIIIELSRKMNVDFKKGELAELNEHNIFDILEHMSKVRCRIVDKIYRHMKPFESTCAQWRPENTYALDDFGHAIHDY